MVLYSKTQLNQRHLIIQSQKLFWSFLDSTMINKLIHLFDSTSENSKVKISTYVENERKVQGLTSSDISVESEVYGQTKLNPTLHLDILKNNKEFLHLTLHLSPRSLEAKDHGAIHFFKNVYSIKGTNKEQELSNKKYLYSIISIIQPANKSNSLEFSIANGYTTNGIQNASRYDPELQQEMNVIITVLNRMFDEDNRDFYIGNEDNLFPIHKNTNTVLNGINIRSHYIPLKNKGTRMYPPFNNNLSSIKSYTSVKKTLKSKMYNQLNNNLNSIKKYKYVRKTQKVNKLYGIIL